MIDALNKVVKIQMMSNKSPSGESRKECKYWREARCRIVVTLITLLASSIWMSVSWILDNGDGTWFARSGAIPAIASIGVTLLLDKYRKIFESDGMGSGAWQEWLRPLQPWITCVQLASLALVCVATLVWAYGDLFYKHFYS